MKSKTSHELPFEEGKTYTTKFQTGEKFLLKKIIYRKKNKPEDPDVPIRFEGIYEKNPELGICPLNLDRLKPEKKSSEFCFVCIPEFIRVKNNPTLD